jgi:hypothetical protein
LIEDFEEYKESFARFKRNKKPGERSIKYNEEYAPYCGQEG